MNTPAHKALEDALALLNKKLDEFHNSQLKLIEEYPDDYGEVTEEDFYIFFAESF